MEFQHTLPDGHTLYVDMGYEEIYRQGANGPQNLPHLEIHFFMKDDEGDQVSDHRKWDRNVQLLCEQALQEFKKAGFKNCRSMEEEEVDSEEKVGDSIVAIQSLEHPIHRAKTALEDTGRQLLKQKMGFELSPVRQTARFSPDGMTDDKIRMLKGEIRYAIVEASGNPTKVEQISRELETFVGAVRSTQEIRDELMAKVVEAAKNPSEIERISQEALGLVDRAFGLSGRLQQH